jgi:hypothetical protein
MQLAANDYKLYFPKGNPARFFRRRGQFQARAVFRRARDAVNDAHSFVLAAAGAIHDNV